MEKVLVKNASDKVQVEKARKIIGSRRDREIEEIKQVLSTISGRKTLWRYMEKTGVFRTSFSTSAHQMAFLEGQRNIGLMILTDIKEADPDKYITMMLEAKEGNSKK